MAAIRQKKIGNITSANATIILTVDELYPNGIQIEQFGTDSAWAQEALQIAETRMGVDGQLVGGYTPNIKAVTLTLEASSPSYDPLATVFAAMDQNKTIYDCTMLIDVPSIGRTFTYSAGCMKTGTPVPAGQKVLAPTTWGFDFANLDVNITG